MGHCSGCRHRVANLECAFPLWQLGLGLPDVGNVTNDVHILPERDYHLDASRAENPPYSRCVVGELGMVDGAHRDQLHAEDLPLVRAGYRRNPDAVPHINHTFTLGTTVLGFRRRRHEQRLVVGCLDARDRWLQFGPPSHPARQFELHQHGRCRGKQVSQDIAWNSPCRLQGGHRAHVDRLHRLHLLHHLPLPPSGGLPLDPVGLRGEARRSTRRSTRRVPRSSAAPSPPTTPGTPRSRAPCCGTSTLVSPSSSSSLSGSSLRSIRRQLS